jgi:hypothetical protein
MDIKKIKAKQKLRLPLTPKEKAFIILFGVKNE